MKKEPKAVYIIENGEYTELTYEEFCHREQICPLYADKLFLPLYGNLMEVSKEDYEEYYRQRNRQIYIDRRASRNGDVSSFMKNPIILKLIIQSKLVEVLEIIMGTIEAE